MGGSGTEEGSGTVESSLSRNGREVVEEGMREGEDERERGSEIHYKEEKEVPGGLCPSLTQR